MPNEILTKVFANFEDDSAPQTQVEKSPFDDPLPRPDLASIKNIRLTCRAFCEVASEVLIPVVDVSFTQSSLQRLEDISSHPTVSKSVRILRVHANCYVHGLVNDRVWFCEEVKFELQNLCRGIFDDATRTEDEAVDAACPGGRILHIGMPWPNDPVLEVALAEVSEVKTVLTNIIYGLRPQTLLDPFHDKISKAIDETREEYGRRFLEQRDLVHDPRALANIINALTRMPNVQKFCVPDEGSRHWDNIFRSGSDKRFDVSKYAASMTGANPLWELMVHGGYRDDSLVLPDEEPLLPLLHKLPLVLQVPNRNLTHIDINFPPLSTYHMEPLAEHLSNLRQAFQSLKSVHIKILQTCFGLDSQATLAMTYSVLTTMLVSPRLEVIKLESLKRAKRSMVLQLDHSIGPALASLPWNNLRLLRLNKFAVKVGELRHIFQKVPGKIHLDLRSIFLLEGTWAEALEILRGKADSSSQIVSARGVEMRNMSEVETSAFLSQFERDENRDGWYADQQCPGPASFYIRGGNIPNPLIRGDDQQD